jgi:DNA-binding MarR family transcriptional regulator
MSNVSEGPSISARPATSRDQLLDRAAERSLVLARVMRLAMQAIRETFVTPSAAGATADSQPLPGAEPAFAEAQYQVLYNLAQAGPLAVGEIAGRCRVAVPTISRMLKHLEDDGLIERHVDRANRRFVRVALTDAGRAAEAQFEERAKSAFHHVLSPLSDEQLADLLVALGHLERLVDQPGALS